MSSNNNQCIFRNNYNIGKNQYRIGATDGNYRDEEGFN